MHFTLLVQKMNHSDFFWSNAVDRQPFRSSLTAHPPVADTSAAPWLASHASEIQKIPHKKFEFFNFHI